MKAVTVFDRFGVDGTRIKNLNEDEVTCLKCLGVLGVYSLIRVCAAPKGIVFQSFWS